MTERVQRLERFTAGEDLPVDPAVIERELSSLWQTASEKGREGGPVSRACLWNVVALSRGAEGEALAKETLAEASAGLPMRGIILLADPREGVPLQAWISANCHIAAGGEKMICSEEVTLHAGTDETHHLPPLVQALLVADLPTALWVIGPPDLSGMEGVLEEADRLIVDSSSFGSIGDLLRIESGGTALGDLNWQRLRTWRVATQDAIGAAGLDRDDVRSVGITRSDRGDCQALLYAGWFLAAFGGGPREGGPVPAIRTEVGREGQDGILSIEIGFEGGAIRIRSEEDGLFAGGFPDGRPPRATRSGDLGLAALLHRELRSRPYDAALGDALRHAQRVDPAPAPEGEGGRVGTG